MESTLLRLTDMVQNISVVSQSRVVNPWPGPTKFLAVTARPGPAQLKSWAVTARPGPAQRKS